MATSPDPRPRRARERVGLGLAGLALLLAACGSDPGDPVTAGRADGDPTTTTAPCAPPAGADDAPSPSVEADGDGPAPTTVGGEDPSTSVEADGSGGPATSGPAAGDDGAPCAAPVCADLALGALQPVRAADADDEGDPGAEGRAALARLARSSVPEVAAPAAVLADLADGDEPTDEQVTAALAAVEDLALWATEHCDLDRPVWGCPARDVFVPVGEAIDVDGATPPAGVAAEPEDVLGAGPDEAVERVEVERDADGALYAWLDDRGLVVEATTVERDGDGWADAGTAECVDPQDDGSFASVGEAIEGTGP